MPERREQDYDHAYERYELEDCKRDGARAGRHFAFGVLTGMCGGEIVVRSTRCSVESRYVRMVGGDVGLGDSDGGRIGEP